MPIYDFNCRQCNARFDKLTSFNWKAAGVRCPTCGSSDIVQLVSRPGGFTSGGKMDMAGGGNGSACTSCHTGSCSTCGH
jgi:putative FmdB family regulatory protein